MSDDTLHTNRVVALFDLDSFFVSVEQKLDPSLKGKPLIVGGRGDRGVVASCSYETRALGVHSAMPMARALKLCPEAVVIPTNHAAYAKHSRQVIQIIAQQVPLFEKASIDEFYIDFSGMGTFEECFHQASDLRQKIKEKTQLVISFGISINKLVSKIAVDTVKPNGEIAVSPGTEKDFLAPMPIEKIPMVGKETASRLHKIGIFTIQQLANSSQDTLRTFFGKQGEALVTKAKGIDFSPVSDTRKHKSISVETTFEEDLSETADLMQILRNLNHKNAVQLRKSGYFSSCVAIKMRFNNFETITRQRTIDPTTSEQVLRKQILALFDQYYTSSSFAGRKIRLIGIRYSGLVDEGFQLNLFDHNPQKNRLQKTIKQLKQKFGENSISHGAEL